MLLKLSGQIMQNQAKKHLQLENLVLHQTYLVLWEHQVAGSNPVAPTLKNQVILESYPNFLFLCLCLRLRKGSSRGSLAYVLSTYLCLTFLRTNKRYLLLRLRCQSSFRSNFKSNDRSLFNNLQSSYRIQRLYERKKITFF